MEIRLPSGGTCEIRPMTGAEEDILSDQELLGKRTMLDKVFCRCVSKLNGSEGTLNPSTGQYFKEDALLALVSDDRSTILVMLRKITYGSEIIISTRCPNKACRTKNTTEWDIDRDILPTFKELAKDEQGNLITEFKTVLPSGKEMTYGLMYGRDEIALAKMPKPSQSDGMLARIKMLDGKRPDLKAIKDLSGPDRTFIRRIFKENKGGYDTDLRIECPSCGTEYVIQLEGQSPFLFPGAES